MHGITVDEIVSLAQRAEGAGFDTLWMAHIRSIDAIAALGVAGRETQRIELGTAVTPTYPRHPMAMAQQALTTAQLSGNRFVLGIGAQVVPPTCQGERTLARSRHGSSTQAVFL